MHEYSSNNKLSKIAIFTMKCIVIFVLIVICIVIFVKQSFNQYNFRKLIIRMVSMETSSNFVYLLILR